jgi:hypothetical protein
VPEYYVRNLLEGSGVGGQFGLLEWSARMSAQVTVRTHGGEVVGTYANKQSIPDDYARGIETNEFTYSYNSSWSVGSLIGDLLTTSFPERGGTGIGGGSGATQQGAQISKDCINLLEQLGIWEKAQQLLKNPPIFDVDSLAGIPGVAFLSGGKLAAEMGYFPWSMANDDGAVYFGSYALSGEAVGQTFDRLRNNHDFVTVRGGGAINGIYYSGSRSDPRNNIHSLLHEVVHLLLPDEGALGSNTNLDEELVLTLDIQKNAGESDSSAVSRFFNSGCDPKIGKYEPIVFP